MTTEQQRTEAIEKEETVDWLLGVMQREKFYRDGTEQFDVERIVRGYADRIGRAYRREKKEREACNRPDSSTNAVDGATLKQETTMENPTGSQIDENTSDGYHTFKELYFYRMLYNAAFFNMLAKHTDIEVVKSKRHSSGELCFGGGWFIVVAVLPTGQISNHYKMKDWCLFDIPEAEIPPKYDGHTPNDAANRLLEYLQRRNKN